MAEWRDTHLTAA